jgi:hypothetical protein
VIHVVFYSFEFAGTLNIYSSYISFKFPLGTFLLHFGLDGVV